MKFKFFWRSRRESILLDRLREIEAENERLKLHLREIRGISHPWIATNAPTSDLERITRVVSRALNQEATK